MNSNAIAKLYWEYSLEDWVTFFNDLPVGGKFLLRRYNDTYRLVPMNPPTYIVYLQNLVDKSEGVNLLSLRSFTSSSNNALANSLGCTDTVLRYFTLYQFNNRFTDLGYLNTALSDTVL